MSYLEDFDERSEVRTDCRDWVHEWLRYVEKCWRMEKHTYVVGNTRCPTTNITLSALLGNALERVAKTRL